MSDITTIFIADDDEDDRMLIREALQSVAPQLRIIECVDGADLLARVTIEVGTSGPKLILMDMNMPKIHGLEALALIRSSEHTLHIPVIMLSTTANPEQVKTAYRGGINAYISKPVELEEYVRIAEAVNMCFLNNYTVSEERALVKERKRTNVMIIEDNEDHSRLMHYALSVSAPHINVIGTQDVESTLEYLSEKWITPESTPQLILLDLYLPARQNGLNLLEAIKTFLSSRQLPAIPIIIVSHSNAIEDITECYRQRANAYMVKSPDLNSWAHYFSYLCHFWMDTIILPKVA